MSSGPSSTPGFSDFSPGLATFRPSMISRFVASTSAMARRRTSFHSMSVRGRRSSVPFRVTIVETESQMKSADGSTTESMMSLIVAVVRNSAALVVVGAGAFAGASALGPAHAAASSSPPPATQSPQNVIGFMRSTPYTNTRIAELQDGRIAEFYCRQYGDGRQPEFAESDLVRPLSAILPFCNPAIDLVERPAPLPAVGRPGDGAHPQSVIFRVAARVPRDDHVVARLQRLARHALAVELQARAPLHRIPHGVALRIFPFHVHERVRIAEQELHQVAFDRLGLVFEVRGGERVMRIRRGRRIGQGRHECSTRQCE